MHTFALPRDPIVMAETDNVIIKFVQNNEHSIQVIFSQHSLKIT
jgi:hypothetical protein